MNKKFFIKLIRQVRSRNYWDCVLFFRRCVRMKCYNERWMLSYLRCFVLIHRCTLDLSRLVSNWDILCRLSGIIDYRWEKNTIVYLVDIRLSMYSNFHSFFFRLQIDICLVFYKRYYFLFVFVKGMILLWRQKYIF